MKTTLLTKRNGIASSKGRFYRRALITFLIVSSIPGLITGALVYWIAGGKLNSELLQMHNNQIELRAQTIDEQLENLELMLSHWAFDSKFDYGLHNPNFNRNFEEARNITQTLLVMQGSNTMNKVVSLYLSGEQALLFDPEHGTVPTKEMIDLYDGLLKSDNVTYWTQMAFNPARPQAAEMTLVHHIPGGSLNPFGALLIRLDNEKVSQMLQTMTPYEGGETFLLQDNNKLFASAEGNDIDSPFVIALREQIASRMTDKGSFFFKWEETNYTVSFGKFARIANTWTYVSASPISSITQPVVFISKIIIVVSSSALLLAAILAWLASQSMYVPVRRLMNVLLPDKAAAGSDEDEFSLIERQWKNIHRESTELHSKLSEQLPYVKESFLQQLLQGYMYAHSEIELLRMMERYKWQVRDHRFIVLYVQLTGIASLEGKFKAGDDGLVTFAAVNIIDELASAHFDQSNTINFHDLAAGLLIIVPKDRSPMEEIQAFSEELTHAVNRILKLRVTIAISRAVNSVTELSHAFESAKHAANFRNFDNENQIIDLEQLNFGGDELTEQAFPFTLEREFIQALQTGQEADAYRLLDAFLNALSCKGAKAIDVQQGMLHLLGSVQHAILIAGIQPNRLFKGANLYEQLSQIREPSLILAWFQNRVTEPFLKELIGRSDSQVKRLIEQAMIYLQQHYMDDISLDSCSDHIGTNPFFLSKSFKQVTGKNFIDYLTGIRMDKAKELLRDSILKINDIAEQVGYQHSYFNRIFKKQEGMTPSQYREHSQAN